MKPPIKGFWGKLLQDKSTGKVLSWLPLSDHCLDVAMVFRNLVELPGIRKNLEQAVGKPLSSTQCDRLAVIAFLHDLGKCNTGFQAKRDPMAHNTAGHVREVAPLFFEEKLAVNAYEALGLKDMTGWFAEEEDLQWMLLASVFHHGKPAFDWNAPESVDTKAMVRYWESAHGLDPFDGLRALGKTARSVFPEAFQKKSEAIKVNVALEHHFAGLVMLADWLGSHSEAFFPFEHEGDRIEWSCQQAKKALAAVGLDVTQARSHIARRFPPFGAIFGIDAEPRPLQSALASAELPHLLVAESDTGSGKTEAALMHFLALFAAGLVDGLYFALPTRVAARELYGRVTAAMQRVFGEDCPPVLLAVPGYTHIDGEPTNILPSETRLCHEDDRLRRERAWAAERPKRFLAAPIAVGTIDQALFSIIQVPHAHLRAACLDRSLLVIDEVHSSDVYMRYLARKLLDRHLKAGGRALLLSATLGSAARAEYLSPGGRAPTPEPFEDAAKQPYPALSAPIGPLRALSDPHGYVKRVKLDPQDCLQAPEALLPRLREAMIQGQRVLVVMNTVSRAIKFTRLVDSDAELAPFLFTVADHRCPHHGRFARPDRELLDKAVSDRLGKGSPAGALLLIGTQTLEQSLDIDSDWLISDLCPIDVLLQRIGRLHRHDRGPRPTPVCTVLLPEEKDFSVYLDRSGEISNKAPSGFGSVYEDLRILQLTRDIVAESPEIEIPRDNRQLVETATHPERLATLKGEAWKRHFQHIEGICGAQQLAAHSAVIPNKHFGDFMFNVEGHLATRLGLNDRCLFLVGARCTVPLLSPFNQSIKEIHLPGHLAQGLDAEQAFLVCKKGDALIIQADPLGQFIYQYTRFGLERIDEPAC
ncbi:MAG: CRISPR-associated helicase Cas3' [Deltaproteobacteria bacterium]